jgi:deazaflavin-dependent oxidoreductase (nitroreductase family)
VTSRDFEKPSAPERLFNRVFGVLVGFGLAPPDYYRLEVRGRKTGRRHAMPVNVVQVAGHPFLVAPRGATQWVRNAEVAGHVVLKRGRSRRQFRIRAVPDADKPEILRAYLDRFRTTVQRYFPVRAGSAAAEFAPIVKRYPVFELLDAARS